MGERGRASPSRPNPGRLVRPDQDERECGDRYRTAPIPRARADRGAAGSDVIPLRQATRAWFAISWQTFGGPAGQIAVMQRALVEDKRWIGQQRFNHALSYCMLLPGPEAQQLAIYTGWLLNGTRGGLIAGSLFVLPGVLALLALSALYVAFGSTAALVGVFAGLAPAVVAIVVQAVSRVARRSLTHPLLIALAAASFAALALFSVPFPAVIATAALTGWLIGRYKPDALNPRPVTEPVTARRRSSRTTPSTTSSPAAAAPGASWEPVCCCGPCRWSPSPC